MRPTGQSQPVYEPTGAQPAPLPRQQRSVWRILVPVLTLVGGIIIGVAGLLLYLTSITSEGQLVVTPMPPPGGDIVGQVSPTFMARVVQNDLASSGLPGSIKNVRIQLGDSDITHNVLVTITGDDQISILGIGMTKHITLIAQLLVQNCQVKANVLSINLGGLPFPVGGFKAAFEQQINQQLRVNTTGLPPGFDYCMTSIHSKPFGLFVTFKATPM